MDGQWESNDLEAFVFEMLKLEGVKKDRAPIVVISVHSDELDVSSQFNMDRTRNIKNHGPG